MNKATLYLLLVFIFVTGTIPCRAVTDSTGISLGYPVYSQYLQNGLIINPAYSGTRGALSGCLSYRMQWMGTKGAPVTQTLSLHAPLDDERIGVGFIAQFMQYGFTRTASIFGSYAYHMKMLDGKLSLGLKAGADISGTVYPDERFLTNPGDPVFVNDKPYVLPNFGTGVYFNNDKYFGGLSIPEILSYRKTGSGSVQPYHQFSKYDIILSGGGLFYISDFFKFKPSVLINYSFEDTKKLTQLDINANLIMADLVWAGISYRISEQVLVAILQIQPTTQLMIGFSYDYPAGRMNSYSKGSTEFTIRYEFGQRISAANPRYF
jgi:type IX secretion system PorP/SprF family membrane protein